MGAKGMSLQVEAEAIPTMVAEGGTQARDSRTVGQFIDFPVLQQKYLEVFKLWIQ